MNVTFVRHLPGAGLSWLERAAEIRKARENVKNLEVQLMQDVLELWDPIEVMDAIMASDEED